MVLWLLILLPHSKEAPVQLSAGRFACSMFSPSTLASPRSPKTLIVDFNFTPEGSGIAYGSIRWQEIEMQPCFWKGLDAV